MHRGSRFTWPTGGRRNVTAHSYQSSTLYIVTVSQVLGLDVASGDTAVTNRKAFLPSGGCCPRRGDGLDTVNESENLRSSK